MARPVPKRRRWPAWLIGGSFLLLLIFSLFLRYGARVFEPRAGTGAETVEAPASYQRHSHRPEDAPPLALRIQLLNATGVSGLALRTGEGLRSWGVDVLDRGNAPPWPFNETLILVRGRQLESAEQLGRYLGGVPVILQRREDLMLDATLVLGQDWRRYDWPGQD